MIDPNSLLYKRWQEKMPEVEMFLNLANSHSNIFLYGSTGVGKTTFA
jgi:flagellar biosynthesis GTPase FlhF